MKNTTQALMSRQHSSKRGGLSLWRLALAVLMCFPLVLFAQTDVSSTYEWKEVKIGGAGFVTGVSISNSGNTVVMRTDVGGGYLWDAAVNKWIQLVTAERLGYNDPLVVAREHTGVEGLAVAPTDENKLYMAYGTTNSAGTDYEGYLYYSNNKGESWVRSNYPSIYTASNGDFRLYGDRLVVDPANKNVAYFGSRRVGLLMTTDGGANWTQIALSKVPAGADPAGITSVDFDKSSGTLSNPTRTKRIMVTVNGVGVYESTDGGNTWANVLTKSEFSDAAFGIDGTYYITLEDPEKKVMRYMNGIWADVTPYLGRWQGVICDPNDANKVISVENGAKMLVSNDKGNTWSKALKRSKTSDEIPWVEDLTDSFIAYGDAVFDPVVPGKMWIAYGFGAMIEDNIYDSNTANFEVISMGMEEGVATSIIKPSGWGNSLMTTSWDYALNYHADIDQYPQKAHHEIPDPSFGAAWEVDYCYNNSNYQVANVQWENDPPRSGYSTDKGLTWTKFASFPPVGTSTTGAPKYKELCGDIAVARNNIDNILWAKNWNLPVYYTLDRGATWNKITLPGVSDGAINNEYNYGDFVVADPNADNTFYIYHFNSGDLFKSTNAGVSWTKISDLPYKAWHHSLKLIPGKPGHMFFCASSSFGSKKLMRSVDGGATWSEFAATDAVQKVALGKEKPGTAYPAIYINGKVNGEPGYWRSTDEGASWEKIATYPKGLFKSMANTFEADPDVYGRVFIGFGGLGFVYGQISGSAPPPPQYTITASAGTNGTITPSGSVVVNEGDDKSFTITPNSGYKVGDVLVDGVSVGAVTSYTFQNVDKGHTISVSFEKVTTTLYRYLKFRATAAQSDRFRLAEIDYKAGGVYYPTQNMTSATAPSPLVVSSSVSTGNYKLYDGSTTTEAFNLASATNITYWNVIDLGDGNAIAPEEVRIVSGAYAGKGPKDFTVEGSNDGTNWTPLLTVTGETNWGVYTSYAFPISGGTPPRPQYTITASAGANGTITPSGSVVVNEGDDQTFTITPNSGYKVGDVLVDGVSVGAVTSYPFQDVDKDHTISASFVALPTTYRYLMFNVTAAQADRFRLAEIDYKAGGVYYPTQNMTSATAPSPLVVSSSVSTGNYKLYDGSTTTEAFNLASATNITYWNVIDLGAGNAISPEEVRIVSGAYAGKGPKDFTVEGSNDGTNWTPLLTVTGETNWGVYAAYTFALSGAKSESLHNEAQKSASSLLVYPNPSADGSVRVVTPQRAVIHVFNSMGLLVQTVVCDGQAEVSGLASGVYVLKAIGTDFAESRTLIVR